MNLDQLKHHHAEIRGSEIYNNYFKKLLKDNDIEMHSRHNEGKSVVAERFIKILKNLQLHDSYFKKCLF